MKLGQGCHKRTPWWCWLVLSISAVLSLPGAMLAVSADEEPATQQDANTREEKAQKNSNASDNTEKNGWIPGNDFHKLQGTWEVVSVQERGRTSRPNEQEQLVYSFLGKKLVVRDRSMPARYDCKYQIDPSKQPKRIDMRVTLDDDGKLETYEVRGIYRFEGDLLWICWEAEEDLGRPKSFSTRPEGQEIVSVFRRVVTGDPADVEKWRFAVECQLFESDKAHPKDKVLLAKDKLLVKDGVKNGCPLRLAGEPPRRPDVSSPSKKSERRPAPKPLSEVDRPRLDVLVCSLPDGRVHLDATVFNNDVVRRNPDTGELRVTGTNGRVVREVKLGDAVKVVCKQDASGKPTLWAELKVGIHRQQVVRNPKAKQGALRLPAVVPDKNGTGRLLFGLGNDSDAAVSGRVLLDERDVDDPRGKQLIPLRKVEGALPADFVVATINGAGIRLEEILSRYSNHLTVARQQQPPDEFRKRQEHLVRRELQEHVDRLLCVQAMRAKLSDEQWPLLARTIDKRFDALIERMSGEFKVSSRDELEAALARQGQSLEFLRKSFEQDTLEREYLALKLRRVAEKDRKAAISSIHSELRAKADVQTVFDAKRVFTFGGIPIRR